MSKGFKKTPVKSAEDGHGESTAEYGSEPALVGAFEPIVPERLPSEEEQEALRQQLRDITNPPGADEEPNRAAEPLEAAGSGAGAAFQNPEAQPNVAIDSALGAAGLGLHHGYPPHDPGEGIRGGLVPTRPKPLICRIVLFSSQEYPEPQPAVITKVLSDTVVNLHVLRDLKSSIPAAKVPLGQPDDWSARRWFWPPCG